ncbi:hypothetical protein GCM10027446_02310 [Angustibacter peucedani]
MDFYLVVLAVCLVVGPISYRRSRSMTRYVTVTGAPVVWVLLGITAVLAASSERHGDPATAQALFTGGLIGTGFAQVVLLRRTFVEHRRPPGPDDPADGPDGPDGPDEDDEATPR